MFYVLENSYFYKSVSSVKKGSFVQLMTIRVKHKREDIFQPMNSRIDLYRTTQIQSKIIEIETTRSSLYLRNDATISSSLLFKGKG